MGENGQFPRLTEHKHIRAVLDDLLPEMRTILEHNRGISSSTAGSSEGRTLKGCVQVQLWTEADGTESIVITGTNDASHLELNAMLHDGVYAMAHQGEPGFITLDS